MNEEEIKLTKRNLVKQKGMMQDAKTDLEYTEKHIEFIKMKWEFEDWKRPYDRTHTLKEAEEKIDQLKQVINQCEFTITEAEKQIESQKD